MKNLVMCITVLALAGLSMAVIGCTDGKLTDTPEELEYPAGPLRGQNTCIALADYYQSVGFIVTPMRGAERRYMATFEQNMARQVSEQLTFLDKVQYPKTLSVNVAHTPPTINGNMKTCDGVFVVEYGYGDNKVVTEVFLVDSQTGKTVWRDRLVLESDQVFNGLMVQAIHVPKLIRKRFYRQ